jgi:hypothetical protein
MALGTTNIDIVTVRNTLGESTYALFALGTSANINKWSRYKPIRDAGDGSNWPAGSNSKYGLNLPTNWNYLQPQGGSPGGSPDEPVRLGDFRGYEHDKDVAGPVIWCTSGNAVVPASITPNITGSGCVATFVANMNTVSASVRILLSDLGYGSYYWGVKVGSYYKTFGTVSDGTNLSFDLTLDLSDPDNPTFLGFPSPVSMDPGTITWKLFISSASATSWTSSEPSGYIEFPGGTGETWGSKTIKSQGTFTLTHWISAPDDETSFGWDWDEGGYAYYEVSHIVTSNDNWHIDTIPTGFGIKDSGGADMTVGGGPYSSGAEIRIFPTANNNTYSAIGPSSFVFHDTDHNEFEIEVVQGAKPAPIAVQVVLSEANSNFEAYEYTGDVELEGNTTIRLYLTIDCLSGTSIPYSITHNSNAAGSGNVTISDNVFCQVNVTCSYGIYSTDTVIVTLDAITPP